MNNIQEKLNGLLEKRAQLDIDLSKQLPKSILQEAIQGRLVPQVPAEGTAQELLDQIRLEKQMLVTNGKLKKSAITDSVIYKADDNKYYERIGKESHEITNEIPFDIPDSWSWIRLGSAISLLSGRDLEPTQYNSDATGIPYITGASNFHQGHIEFNRWTNSPTTVSVPGELLITCKGTIGAMAFNTIGKIHIARQIMAIGSKWVSLNYIMYYLTYCISQLENKANSMIPGISRDVILQLFMSLPPLQEQKRIVDAIGKLFKALK